MKSLSWKKVLGSVLGAILVSAVVITFLFGSMAILDTIAPPKGKLSLSQSVAAAPSGPTPWTIGNNSYIPIPGNNEYGSWSDKSRIMRLEAEFESAHPQLHVISYTLDISIHEAYAKSFLDGIWVHHEPK